MSISPHIQYSFILFRDLSTFASLYPDRRTEHCNRRPVIQPQRVSPVVVVLLTCYHSTIFRRVALIVVDAIYLQSFIPTVRQQPITESPRRVLPFLANRDTSVAIEAQFVFFSAFPVPTSPHHIPVSRIPRLMGTIVSRNSFESKASARRGMPVEQMIH